MLQTVVGLVTWCNWDTCSADCSWDIIMAQDVTGAYGAWYGGDMQN